VSTSSPSHMPYCTGHYNGGDLCISESWTVAGVRLKLYGHETDVPPTAIRVDTGTYRCAYTVEETSRLAEALTALGMLAIAGDVAAVAYWSARLDVLAAQDQRVAS
jgi:hypothetical protein